MPTDILIYAIIAGVLVVWLRNVLGTRNGDEQQRPNPYLDASSKKENVVGIDGQPFMETDLAAKAQLDVSDSVAGELESISKALRDFAPHEFVENAKNAFVMVVEAFAKGEKDTLEMLLAPAVYKSFADVLAAREKSGEKVETEIHAVRKADIIEAYQKDGKAYVVIRFTADETCVISDKDGNAISGDPDRITEMVDVWTFGRVLKSKDPVWHVYETRDDVEEEHKTPLPDTSE